MMRQLALAALLFAGAACAAEPPPLTLGVAWYPEQWPERQWAADPALMQSAGIRMVRVGEFAWSSINHTTQPAKVALRRPMTDLLNGGEIREREIAPRGVVVASNSF